MTTRHSTTQAPGNPPEYTSPPGDPHFPCFFLHPRRPRASRSAALRRARHPLLEPPEVVVDVALRHRRRLLGVHAGPELLLDDGAPGRVVARGRPARCIPQTPVSHLFVPATPGSHVLAARGTHLVGRP